MQTKGIILSASLSLLMVTVPAFSKDALTSNAKFSAAKVEDMRNLGSIAAIDKNEILLGVVASHKDLSSNVNKFAEMMVDQHGANLNQLLELVNNAHANSLSGGEASKLAAEGNKDLLKLGALTGNTFEKAYVEAMVKGHQAALNLIDQHLLKSAKSDDVKKFLTDTREAVAKHLDHAKKLQADLK